MTPRTDREIWWVGFKPDERLEAVWADFARDLELENAALREELEYAIKAGARREADLLVMLGKEAQL